MDGAEKRAPSLVQSGADDFEKIRKRATLSAFDGDKQSNLLVISRGQMAESTEVLEKIRKMGKMPVALSVTEEDIEELLHPERLVRHRQSTGGGNLRAICLSHAQKE